MSLAPRTIVTGGTRGIGAAAARRLLADGHEVVALGRRDADMTDACAVAAAFARADEDRLGFTGLVVSAGIWEPSPLTDDVAACSETFRRILDVNLLGAVHAVAAFVPHARGAATESAGGRPAVGASAAASPSNVSIVLVGSTAGQRGESGYAAYAASKAALAGLSKSWAVELAPRGIRVNVVSPGWVDTEMTAGALGDPASRARIEAGIPRGRVASADDLAGPIAFLLSDDSVHVTGSILSVNGGAVMGSA